MRRNASGLRHGFKAASERLALEVRAELRLTPFDSLDPRALAEHLGIPVVTLPQLASSGASSDAITYFLEKHPDDFSAMTLCEGSFRLIVENPSHSSRRRVTSLAHEVAHVLLEHQPGPVLGAGGCRRWSQADEQEADWLAGVLLVPRPAALALARSGEAGSAAAQKYGVSAQLMDWRLNQSGARRQANNERNYRRRSVAGQG